MSYYVHLFGHVVVPISLGVIVGVGSECVEDM